MTDDERADLAVWLRERIAPCFEPDERSEPPEVCQNLVRTMTRIRRAADLLESDCWTPVTEEPPPEPLIVYEPFLDEVGEAFWHRWPNGTVKWCWRSGRSCNPSHWQRLPRKPRVA